MPPYRNLRQVRPNDPVPTIHQIRYVGHHFRLFRNDPRTLLWRREQERQFVEDLPGMPFAEIDEILNTGYWDRLAYNQAVSVLNEYADHRRSLDRQMNSARRDPRRALREGEDKENVEPPYEQDTIFV